MWKTQIGKKHKAVRTREYFTMERWSTNLTSSNVPEANKSDYKKSLFHSHKTKIVKLKMKNYGEESL